VKVTTYAGCMISSLAVFLAAPAHAQSKNAQPSEATATAQRLIVRSGVAVQLRGFTGQIESEIRQNQAGLDAKMLTALVEAAREAFRPESLQEDITGRMATKLTVADMKTALVWLDGAAGRRITRAEELGSTFDAQGFQAYAEQLKTQPVSPQRQKLISELIAVTDAVKALAASQEAIALGVALGMDSLQPRERRAGEAALRGRLRELMPPEKLQAMFAEQLPGLFAYTYRDISDADFGGYVRFLRTVSGKRYQAAMNASFVEGLERASVRVGELAAQRQRQTAI
jgi:hypothetical protein